ncbi:MAG: DMT family transporter [Lachnospiraceae bacterium]|nr:DMT family transporter [Lachnospiraceae bacterium]
MKKTSFRNPLLLLLTAVIWGVAFVAQSVGMEYVGPFTFNFVRSMIGGLVLIPCIFLLDRVRGGASAEKADRASLKSEEKTEGRSVSGVESEPQYTWKQKELFVGGICCGTALFVASNLQQFGIKYTTVGKAGFITALYIVLVPLLGIFLKKAVGLKIWISVALTVAGLYLLCITDGFSIRGGDFLVLLCALCFSVHILVIDYFSPKVDGVRMSCIQFFVCGLLSGIAMLFTEQFDLNAVLMAWMPILYAGVMSCGVAYTLQIVGQKGMNPTVASLILSLESVVSVLAGWLILGQKLSPRELSGCVLMFAAIILAQIPQKK